MRVAIIGSRGLEVEDFSPYLPADTTELVSGGAKGIDQCALSYAQTHHLPIREFLPDYQRYHKGAPLKRNREIVAYSDLVLAFWDGKSRGTMNTVDYCKKTNTPYRIIRLEAPPEEE